MPHPLATQLNEISTRLIGVTQRRQLAEIAADLQKLTVQVDAALVDDADERIAKLTDRIRLLERCFNYDHTGDGVLAACITSIEDGKLVITVPAVAGITQVPFDVIWANAQVVEGDLLIEISPNYA